MLQLKIRQDTTQESIADPLPHFVATSALNSNSKTPKLFWFEWIFLLALVAYFSFYNLGEYQSFGNGDQTTHVIAVQEMVYSGDFLHPRVRGAPYYQKPPFKMWLSALIVSAFGESNFAYRFMDGVGGAVIFLSVFFFGLSLFRSRIVAYGSLFALFGCGVLFFGHGIRNATQDGMMLCLVTLTMIAVWQILELVRLPTSPETEKSIWRYSILGGFLTGAAVLTKNVPGYYPFIFAGIYCLVTGQVASVLRRAWKPLTVALVISLVCPLAFLLSQGEWTKLAFQVSLFTEVYKRAVRGYHRVNDPAFYLKLLFCDTMAVSVPLLCGGMGYGMFRAIKDRDRRYAFLLVWALVPVILQSIAKSRLEWYILPALPGIALLCGCFFAAATPFVLTTLQNILFHPALFLSRPFSFWAFLVTALFSASIVTQGYLVQDVIAHFTGEGDDKDTERIVRDLLTYQKKTGEHVRIAQFTKQKISHHEYFFWRMIMHKDAPVLRKNAALAAVRNGSVDILLTDLPNIEALSRIRPFESATLLPPMQSRKSLLAVLSYLPNFHSRPLTPKTREFEFGSQSIKPIFGLDAPMAFHEREVRLVKGTKAGIAIMPDYFLKTFGATAELTLASLVPESEGKKLHLQIALNNTEIASFFEIQEGFQKITFSLPPSGFFNETGNDQNLLIFDFTSTDAEVLQRVHDVALIERLTLRLNQ